MSTEESFQTENDSQQREDEFEYSYDTWLSGLHSTDSHSPLALVDELSQMIAEMHLRGINVRYLILIYNHLKVEKVNASFLIASLSHTNFTKVKQLVLTEAVARTVKHEIEGSIDSHLHTCLSLTLHPERWRQSKAVDDIEYERIVVNYLNEYAF